MKKYLLLLCCSLCLVCMQSLLACTTFFLNKDGQLIFGRNYDWISDAGMVCTNLKGLNKTSMPVPDGGSAKWVSKYGSITFNQFGKELPNGGMNEKGLVVEMMWADGSKYPEADAKPAVHVLQWIQYQLDNNATVEEVIASDTAIRISVANPPVHFLVADANGHAATIEFFDGRLVVHQGQYLPFPVLTNNPYDQSAKTAKDANVLTGNTSFSFQDNSLQRFTNTCSMVQQYQHNKMNKPIVEYAFDILDKASQKEFTKWSIVYDVQHKKIFFKTAHYTDVKSLAFQSFNFDCTAPAKVINMNQLLKGPVSNNFVTFSNEINRTVMEKAIEESKSQVPISNEAKEANLAYAMGINCAH